MQAHTHAIKGRLGKAFSGVMIALLNVPLCVCPRNHSKKAETKPHNSSWNEWIRNVELGELPTRCAKNYCKECPEAVSLAPI